MFFFFFLRVEMLIISQTQTRYHRVKVFYNNRDRITTHIEEEDGFVHARGVHVIHEIPRICPNTVISPSCWDASVNKPPLPFPLKSSLICTYFSRVLTSWTTKQRVPFNFTVYLWIWWRRINSRRRTMNNKWDENFKKSNSSRLLVS